MNNVFQSSIDDMIRCEMTAADAADRFWTCSLCRRGMLLLVESKWFMVLGSTPCLVYVSCPHMLSLKGVKFQFLKSKVWPMLEIECYFEGELPDLVMDECRIPKKMRNTRFRDCLNKEETVKALCFDLKAFLISIRMM